MLGELEYSLEAYKRAVQLEDAKPSYIASTRKQALQISSLYEEESIRSHIVDAFPTLGIVACSGHLIDNPGKRRFPQEAEEIVRLKIDEKLDKLGATCGYSSAGCGTDLIFLEAMQERKLIFFFLLPKINLSKPAFIARVRIGLVVLKKLSITPHLFIM